jgi:ectoine hydroxylase-related dioxygenase (phytanoyl-CoA dioxygenase family)
MLTEDQVKQFYEEGYVVVKNVIPESKLQEYRDAYERMVEKVRANPSREKYNTRLIKHIAKNQTDVSETECWGCDFLLHPDLYEPAFTDYLNNEKLLSALGSILGDDLRVEGLKAIWSPVNITYDLFWHRDGLKEVYSEDGSQKHIQFNTALYHDESFRIVPGSHRRPLTEEELAQVRNGGADLPGQLICTLEPGDAMFMHSMALHRGMTPYTTKRRTLHYILARADLTVGTNLLKQYKGWYEEQKLGENLAPTAKKLFERMFAWEGNTKNDDWYPNLPYKE